MNILDLSNNNLVDIKDNKIKCIGILNLQNNKLTEFNINNMFNGIWFIKILRLFIIIVII